MLETLDLEFELKKAEYRERIRPLRNQLRDLQRVLRSARVPVIVLFEGWEAAGKGDSIASLVYPLDPRGFQVHSMHELSEEELSRPFLWRYATRFPRRGELCIFDRSWYRFLLEERVDGNVSPDQMALYATAVRELEEQLHRDRFVLVKIWLHISKKEQEKRFKKMEEDPYERWRITQRDRRRHRAYKEYLRSAEEMLSLTDTAEAPWTLIPATDRYYRRARVLESALEQVRAALRRREIDPEPDLTTLSRLPDPKLKEANRTVEITDRHPVLDRVDLTRTLELESYEKKLHDLQGRFRELQLACHARGVPVIIVYEGWDAAGKGGNIKRLTQELDPRGYTVIPISAPDDEERSRHYLWRFWTQVPRAGHIAIFDRSWYGRLMVERVEGFASEDEWRRAFEEINHFERHLVRFGTVLIKFWLQISPEEQLRRFEARERQDHKRHKITDDDWRNRGKWNEYRQAIAEMIEKTSTARAPWTLVGAEDKRWARIRALETVVGAVEARLEEE